MALGLARNISNGISAAIGRCGVAAIGTALRESRPPGFSYHSSNWHGMPDLLCQNARDDNLGLTEIVNGKLCNRRSDLPLHNFWDILQYVSDFERGRFRRHFGSDQSVWRDGDWNGFVRIALAELRAPLMVIFGTMRGFASCRCNRARWMLDVRNCRARSAPRLRLEI